MCAQLSWIERLATDQKVGGSNPLAHVLRESKMLSLFCFYGILKSDKRTKHVGIKTKQEDICSKLESIKKTHLHKLNELHRNATNKGNQWELTYLKREDAYIGDLSEKFLTCYKQYTKDIDQLIYNLSTATPNNIDELYVFLTQFNKDIKNHTDLFQKPLYDAAKAWVAHEENKLRAMKKEQKKMLPNLDIAN